MKNYIKQFRSRAGMTQEQLAEVIDTTAMTISRLELGKLPIDTNWLEKITPVLKCTAGEIFDGPRQDDSQTPYLRDLMINTIIFAHELHKNNALEEEEIAEFAADCYEGFLKDEAEDLKSYMRAYNRAKTG